MVRLLSCAVLLALGACANLPPSGPALPRDELLSGAALDGMSEARAPLDRDAVFRLDDEMRAFVAATVGGARDPSARLRRLLAGMEDRGLFSLDYSNAATHTVRDTFYGKEGNCLSFTMLFVALAREAGLRVTYQMVDVPPRWSAEGDLVILVTHINTLVNAGQYVDYMVDFNTMELKGNFDRRQVTDDYALALYYTNVGAEALVRRDHATALLHLKAAIETYPGLSAPWVNLGVLYSRQRLRRHAESAYLHALAADPRERSALSNLATLYAAMGEEELAQQYQRRIRYYQQRNPYYHYSLAQHSYEQHRFAETLERLDVALRLKRTEHQFYHLQSLAHLALGHPAEARRSLQQARRHAELGEVQALYDEKLAGLAAQVARP